MKGLKIVNIILFTIICAIEIFVLYYFFSSLAIMISGSAVGVVAAILACLPMIIVLSGSIFVLAIILTITTKARIRKIEESGLPALKSDKILMMMPWFFLMFNILGFAILIIIADKK